MKHLAVALVVVALIAADFGADVWLAAKDQHAWAWADTCGLVFAGWWFWHHRSERNGGSDVG